MQMKSRGEFLEVMLESLMPFGVVWKLQAGSEGHQIRWRVGCATYSVVLRYDVGEGLVATTLERLIHAVMIQRYATVSEKTYRVQWQEEGTPL